MMQPLDVLLAPDFPHATPEGYRQGCRGAVCSGRELYGFTCAQAHIRAAGDYRYSRWVEAGLTPADVVRLDAAHAETVRREEAEQRKQTHARPAKPRHAVEDRTSRAFTAKVAVPAQSVVEPVTRAPAARREYRYFTPVEDALIRLAVYAGLPDAPIAAALDRPMSSVRQRRHDVLHLERNFAYGDGRI
jgi:hypothetical protein